MSLTGTERCTASQIECFDMRLSICLSTEGERGQGRIPQFLVPGPFWGREGEEEGRVPQSLVPGPFFLSWKWRKGEHIIFSGPWSFLREEVGRGGRVKGTSLLFPPLPHRVRTVMRCGQYASCIHAGRLYCCDYFDTITSGRSKVQILRQKCQKIQFEFQKISCSKWMFFEERIFCFTFPFIFGRSN